MVGLGHCWWSGQCWGSAVAAHWSDTPHCLSVLCLHWSACPLPSHPFVSLCSEAVLFCHWLSGSWQQCCVFVCPTSPSAQKEGRKEAEKMHFIFNKFDLKMKWDAIWNIKLTLASTLMLPPFSSFVLDDVRVVLFLPVLEMVATPALLLVSLCLPACCRAGRCSPCTSSTQDGCLELRMFAALGLQDSCRE